MAVVVSQTEKVLSGSGLIININLKSSFLWKVNQAERQETQVLVSGQQSHTVTRGGLNFL